MKKVAKKNITNDDLAIMVANGFSSVDKRFDAVDVRFNKVEDRLTKVESELTGVRKRVDELNDNIKSTRQEISKVGDRFVARHEFDTLLTRVIRIEQRLQGKHK